jgi:hypothetical protein
MKYGELPVSLGTYHVACKEMMFYQYLPVKLSGQVAVETEQRLSCFDSLLDIALQDFHETFGSDAYLNTYVYITAKRLFNLPGRPYNRPGYHSDGFMTDDINYIWSDCLGTIFNDSRFMITPDDQLSLIEMEQQALSANERRYPDGSLLRLNQYCIHKVQDITAPNLRTFVKISFSRDKYDLEGNSHNYNLDYHWDMKPRRAERNIPQSSITNNGKQI